ncbi:IS3 family transposase, partial [Apilactobacillus micheneri]
YFSAGIGSTSLAKKYNIKSRTTILNWIHMYNAFGIKGLIVRKPIKVYSGNYKRKVLHWMHTNHSSYPETALFFNISAPSTIFAWERRLETKGLTGLYTNRGPKKMKSNNIKFKSLNKSLKNKVNYYLINYRYEQIKQEHGAIINHIKKLINYFKRFSISFILKSIGVSRSYYYRHLKEHDKDIKLKKMITKIKRFNPNYGYRRVTLALINNNVVVNHKKVLRLMKTLKLTTNSYNKKSRKYNSYIGKVGHTAKNRLHRKFKTDRPYQKLTTDVSEFRYGNQDINHRVYLSPIMDLFSDEILTCSISEHPTVDFTIKPMKALIKTLPNLEYRTTVHSDQGFQYQNNKWQRLLKNNHIFQSMSRKGTCLDNAQMESFFHIMKTEVMNVNYETKDSLIKTMKNWIKYYNKYRIKTKLGGKAPKEYRELYLLENK